jgi:hypothetical protein
MNSRFFFIQNNILRQNLDEAFDHILILLPFTESSSYNSAAKSSFRKTIIIYTASIVEALLFHLLEKKVSEHELVTNVWELKNKKLLHTISQDHQIVAGDYKKTQHTIDKEKLNLGQISTFLKSKQLIKKPLFNEIDEIRIMRNDQHIGAHQKVKSYSKQELDRAFSIASNVRIFVMQNI